MTAMMRVRAVWTGFPGAPGVSTFYFLDAIPHLAALRAFFDNQKTTIPADVQISIEGSGDIIESTTGLIQGSWAGVAPAQLTGTDPGSYLAPAGGMIRWATTGLTAGRRIRGRTYLVPLVSSNFSPSGAPTNGLQGGWSASAATLIAAVPGNLLIFQRPRVATAAWTDVHGRVHPAVLARAGKSAVVTTGTMSPKAVVLTSRRD